MAQLTWSRHSYSPLLIIGVLVLLLYGGRHLAPEGFIESQTSRLRLSHELPTHEPSAPLSAQNHTLPQSRRLLIQSGGIPREGFGSTLWFLKPSVEMAHVLGRDLKFAQSAELFGYVVTSLLQADTIQTSVPQTICDLHNTVLEDQGFGEFHVRVERSMTEVDAFSWSITEYCMGDGAAPYEMLPHIRQRLESCDVVIWADQRLRAQVGWNRCQRPWLRSKLGRPTNPRKKTIGVHYRWGDMFWSKDPKWMFDNAKVEAILSAIRACDSSYDVSIYMKASSATETPEERHTELQPIKSFDRIVDTGDDLSDLIEMATHDILILNSGSYSEAAAGASSARMVIHNGHHPHFFEYLKAQGTTVMDTNWAAQMEWCKVLEELT